MKRQKRGPSGPKSLLTEEDHALWEHAASTIDPARRLKARVHHAIKSLDAYMAGRPEPLPGTHDHHRRETSVKPHPVPPQPSAKKAPPLADFTRKSARKLRSGQVEIEARIDLHGMRQNEAHAALRRFVLHCHNQDRRWVLVITGKGGPADARQNRDYGHSWSEPERGVLRRNVPRWLAEPDLRAIVVSYTTAAIHHGGEGALYLQLRSRRRTGV